MTIGETLNRLKTEIFEINSSNEFVKKCRKREEELKIWILNCFAIIEQHIQQPGLTGNLPRWKEDKIKSNISVLTNYMEELLGKLNEDEIKNYVFSYSNSFFLNREPIFPDWSIILLHSYYGSIITDISWIGDLEFDYTIKISSGKLDLNVLGTKLPNRILDIEKFLKDNKILLREYSGYIKIIEEALSCHKSKYNKAFNLLVITSIEGIVRKFGEYLIKVQDLNVDLSSDKYNSIDAFLRKIPWKNDLNYTNSSVMLLTSHVERSKQTKSFEDFKKMSLLSDGKYINYYTRLHFLKRRFKENRDFIVHGMEVEYDKDWQSYVNLSALFEVLKTMREYKKLYYKKTAANMA